jgi:uncharacterized repeat protein (TIGR03806 family)
MTRFVESRLVPGTIFFALWLAACGSDTPPGGTGTGGASGSPAQSGGQSGAANTGGQAGSSSGGMVAAGGSTSGGTVGAGGATGGASGAGGSAGAAGARDMEAGAPDSGTPAPCSPPAKVDAPIEKLSDTGCMDPNDVTKLAPYVLPYEVNSPLWSDSADKSRGMRVPDGKKIHVKDCAKEPALCPAGTADEGKWLLPVGTVMVKNFLFDGKLVETRLFVHFDASTWVGYSYAWNEAQTEATVVPNARKQVMFDTGKRKVEWNYPDRFDCMLCHNPQGGGTIGPETSQMNRVVGAKNQIDTWQAMGLFDTPPAKDSSGKYTVAPLVLPYAGQLGTPPASATVAERTRSYLHANCAFCHRPDGDFMPLDLRLGTAFKDMGLCNQAPAKGDVGVPGAVNLAPGKPDQSVMYLRMTSLENQIRMPKIASYQVDDQGVKLVSDWIKSITTCPQ